MRARLRWLPLAWVLIAVLAPSWTTASLPLELDAEADAQQLVKRLAAGEFEAATERFDETMRGALPPDRLKATWAQVEGSLGKLVSVLRTTSQKARSSTIVLVTCRFERTVFDVKIVYAADESIEGLWFLPTPPGYRFEPPPYADASRFSESPVTIGDVNWSLPATLSLPKGEGPFPAIVLVHGSGPQYRDETVGGHKVFRDLAQGLATRGIAVLRYEKRTRHYAALLTPVPGHFTVDDETVDDAVSAVRFLQQTKAVDNERLYLAGHSLGGLLAPRIGRRAPELRGLVLLAASIRPTDIVLAEQLEYLAGLDGEVTAEERKPIEEIRAFFAYLDDPVAKGPAPPCELLSNVPVNYWRHMRAYDAGAAARDFAGRILVLQGERDYQVTLADFEAWKKELAGHERTKFLQYPGLNHLFVEGNGTPSPQEYAGEGHVAENVVADIAAWILEPAAAPDDDE